VLLDVGAGSGYFSLAAAARGHRVIAFELSPRSLLSFEASIAYNGFQDRIALHKVRWSPKPIRTLSFKASIAYNSFQDRIALHKARSALGVVGVRSSPDAGGVLGLEASVACRCVLDSTVLHRGPDVTGELYCRY